MDNSIDEIVAQRRAEQAARRHQDDEFAAATVQIGQLVRSTIDRFVRSLQAAPSAAGCVRLVVRQDTSSPQPRRRRTKAQSDRTIPEIETAVGWLLLAGPWVEIGSREIQDSTEYTYSASALVVCDDQTLRVGLDADSPEVTRSIRFSNQPGPLPEATTLCEERIYEPIELLDSWAFAESAAHQQFSSPNAAPLFYTGTDSHTSARRRQFENFVGALDQRLGQCGVEWADDR